MPAKPSLYYRPKSPEEAQKYLIQPETKPLGGGTKLIASGYSGAVVDLQDTGLDYIEFDQGCLKVGAMTKLADLSDYLVQGQAPGVADLKSGPDSLLIDAIHRSGPNTYRNAATVGGMLASYLPDSEFLAALLVLEADVLFADGENVGAVEYIESSLKPGGLIVEVTVPWKKGQGSLERVARTPADYPIVSVTLYEAEGEGVRLAATGIDERPVRLVESEAILGVGGGIEAAAEAARDKATHPGDFRGDPGYRAQMAYVLTKRVLHHIL